MRSVLSLTLVAAVAAVRPVLAWGAAGHEIVATIAQIHLHPSTKATLCDILPDYAKCHLAPVATWADNVRYRMRWSSNLHYVNSAGDHPSDHCVWGENGWDGPPHQNVLSAIQNTTTWLANGYTGAEEALKFLVHFLGDLHQPLHLTGRDRGGNSVKVKFDGRTTNLHSVWDSSLIAKAIRTVPLNYTRPLPSRRIESELRDTIYDAYIRQIMFEGVLGRFKSDIEEWTTCPPAETTLKPRRSQPTTIPAHLYPIVPNQLPLGLTSFALPQEAEAVTSLPPDLPQTDDGIVCPFFWATPLHQLNCDIIWPPALDDPEYAPRVPNHYLELDTPEYAGRVKKEWVLERLLAMGGLRLAAILNYLFADEQDAQIGLINFNAVA